MMPLLVIEVAQFPVSYMNHASHFVTNFKWKHGGGVKAQLNLNLSFEARI